MPSNKKNVTYCYYPSGSSYFISSCHPMDPERVNMTHELVRNYGLFEHMNIIKHSAALESQLKAIHTEDYIEFVKKATPTHVKAFNRAKSHSDPNEDCPMFKGVFDYMSSSVGGSLYCANDINLKKSNIAINWSGGMHHAKRSGPSGFCYANDIAACIIELLRYHKRVMYIDIDVHHGDAVESMFYDTNRVMTVSFHHGRNFFPGTGAIKDIGVGEGKNYAINVPLKSGIDSHTYLTIFTSVIDQAIERYYPEAIVMQMGADSVAGDRLGKFNLSNVGHAKCLQHVKAKNIPMVILGGGGYTPEHVAKTWTLETGVALGMDLLKELPDNGCIGDPNNDETLYFSSNYSNKAERGYLYIPAKPSGRSNNSTYINKTISRISNIISQSEVAPSVQLQTIPPDWYNEETVMSYEQNHYSKIVRCNGLY